MTENFAFIPLTHSWFRNTTLEYDPVTQKRRWTYKDKILTIDPSVNSRQELSQEDIELCFSVLSTDTRLPLEFVASVLKTPVGIKVHHMLPEGISNRNTEGESQSELLSDIPRSE